jgi:hypothetical protein
MHERMQPIAATEPRFARPLPPALAGDARPGDVLALAGGALVRDVNANGLVDGRDARVDTLAGVDAGRYRGALVDVRG